MTAAPQTLPKKRSLKELQDAGNLPDPILNEGCEEICEILNCISDFGKLVHGVVKKLESRVSYKKKESISEEVESGLMSNILKGALFVGHINTDLDSVAGAIGGAELFEGTPTISEEKLNGEILFALDECGIDVPPLFDKVPGAVEPLPDGTLLNICLVDHNEEKQMVKALREDPTGRKNRIVGLIDHHAISSSFCSDAPLFIDVRPWGSMSTIVASLYTRMGVRLRPQIARLLLMAILSDTLNLLSVTTTDADRFTVAVLTTFLRMNEVDDLANRMFKAKTKWIINLGAYEMVRGDQKDFETTGWKFGISVLEVTNTKVVLEVAQDLLFELRLLKKEKGQVCKFAQERKSKELDFAYLFIVDVTKQNSYLLICGGREKALAELAFPEANFQEAGPGIVAPGATIESHETMMFLPGLVSRKKQFGPAFFDTLNSPDFKCHKDANSKLFLGE